MARSAERYDDDAGAVGRVLAGDVDAFEGIVQRWQGPLVNMAFRFCRDRGVAEEMAQEAFLKIFKGLSRWRQDARFSTWMFSVALNQYRSAMRRHRPHSVALNEVAYLAAGDRRFEVNSDLRDDAAPSGGHPAPEVSRRHRPTDEPVSTYTVHACWPWGPVCSCGPGGSGRTGGTGGSRRS